MARRRFWQILALVGLSSLAGCAHWCANHYPPQQGCCCQPCCCAPAAGYAAPAPTWNQPAACTCAPVGR